MKKYGYFSQDRREFIITRPDTPAPWVNYISNGRYNGIISNTGGGFSFYKSPKDSRITRWRYNSLPLDRPGRYILLQDADTQEYWSPTWQPTCVKLDSYECRHGLYYTKISSEYKQLAASVLYFVPTDDVEIWKLSVKNNSSQPRTLNLFSFSELCMGHALIDLINQPNDQHFNEVYFNKSHQLLFATKRYWVRYNSVTVEQANGEWDKYVFFGSSLPVKGWDGSKDVFMGRWRSEENPIAVERGACFNSEITAGDAIAALQTKIILEPGEEKDVVFFLGVVDKSDNFEKTAAKLADKYRNVKTVNEEFSKRKRFWNNYTNAVKVNTPDDDMNTMLNVWNQYQTSVTFLFSRDASYYHGGLLFGRGYRDSCQDILGPVIQQHDRVRERIREMSAYQFHDGSTFHLYYPLTGGGVRTGHSDTPLWLPLAIMTYLKETGDFDFLKQVTKFHDEKEGSILEHLYRAIDYTLGNLTERYLAKFGPGDWNDTLDYLGREGRGESIWVSMFLAYILKEAAELCRMIGDVEHEKKYQREYQKVSAAINEHCWDGEWYIRGTNDIGEVIGSAKNAQGQIFLNTQSWAVISGVASDDRAIQCMNSVIRHLDTPKGPKILHPAYTKVDPNIGLATRCVPGKKENGAVFNHPVSWAILAECMLGHGNRAFEIFKKALPMNPEIEIDRYQAEPYVYAEYVTSPDHPTYGQASHSWLTGSSAWMLRGGIDYILGVRPSYCGLVIDPCIPANWTQYTISRLFRGIRYNFRVENPQGICKGKIRLTIEGQDIEENVIDLNNSNIQKLLKDKSEVAVVAVLE